MEPHFVHPLSSVETIDTDEGQKEVMNSWAFASYQFYVKLHIIERWRLWCVLWLVF